MLAQIFASPFYGCITDYVHECTRTRRTGVTAYLVLFFIGRTFLYDEAALEGLRQAVSVQTAGGARILKRPGVCIRTRSPVPCMIAMLCVLVVCT